MRSQHQGAVIAPGLRAAPRRAMPALMPSTRQKPTMAQDKPKLSAEERRARLDDRLTTIRLRMAIYRELDEREITASAAIGEAQAANDLVECPPGHGCSRRHARH